MKWTLWRRWSTERPGWPGWRSHTSSFASMSPSWGAGGQLDSLICLNHLPPQDHFRDQNGLETTIETKMSHLFMRSRWAPYFTWDISLNNPTYVAGTCHPWAVHRTQNKHTSRKYLCSSFLVLWFVIAMKDEIFLKTKIFFIAPTWPQSEAAPWTETSTDSLSTRWKSTREVFTTTLSFVQQGGLF